MERFPNAFEHLFNSAYHAADRAWTGLGHFFLGQSVLVLAWAALVDSHATAKPLILMSISFAGMVMGFQWALLSTRMWHYHLEYMERLRRLYSNFSEETHGAGAPSWSEVDEVINLHWRDNPNLDRSTKWFLRFSGNHLVLFSAPLLLSFVHFVMLDITIWPFSFWAGIGVGVVFCLALAMTWKICVPVLTKQILSG